MTTKTAKKDGFLMVFWSLWVLGPILAHQTAKFKLSGQFCFSIHPWGPWKRQSSGVICIWKIFQLFSGWQRHLVKKNCFLQIEAWCHLYYLKWLKSDIITMHSHNSIIFKEIYSLKSWFWNISMKIRSACIAFELQQGSPCIFSNLPNIIISKYII